MARWRGPTRLTITRVFLAGGWPIALLLFLNGSPLWDSSRPKCEDTGPSLQQLSGANASVAVAQASVPVPTALPSVSPELPDAETTTTVHADPVTHAADDAEGDVAVSDAEIIARETRPGYYSQGTPENRAAMILDHAQAGNLHSVAMAREYKNELIIFAADIGQAHYALNLILNLHKLGYYHYIMVGFNQAACDHMLQFDPSLACVWDGGFEADPQVVGRFFQSAIHRWKSEETNPRFHDHLKDWKIRGDVAAWMSRWKVMSRLVSMGFNVMMTDTDTAVIEDVYPYLKSPPIRNHTLMFHAEDHMDANVQCGFVYCHHARPGGAARWVLAQVPATFYKIVGAMLPEDHWLARARQQESFFFDQNLMRDAVLSSIMRRQLHRDCIMYHHSLLGEHEEAWVQRNAYNKWITAHGPLRSESLNDKWHVTDAWAEAPARWRRRFLLRRRHVMMTWHPIHADVQTSEPEDVEALVLGLGSNPLLDEWQATLQGDVGIGRARGGAGWRGRGADAETVAMLPVWIVCHWRVGRWGQFGVDPPGGIVLHATNAIDKLALLKALGLYDYRANAALASTTLQHRLFVQGRREPVVAYHPDVDLAIPRDHFASQVVHTISLAAVLSSRVPAFPNVPCSAPWLMTGGQWEPSWEPRGAASAYQPAPGAPATPLLTCRSGFCHDWRLVPYGYTSQEEADAYAAVRRDMQSEGFPGTVFDRRLPTPQMCVIVMGAALDDEPKHAFGDQCKSGHDPDAGKALSPLDLRQYVETAGAEARPDHARNVLFSRPASPEPSLLNGTHVVSIGELREELERFSDQLVVYLPWRIEVQEPPLKYQDGYGLAEGGHAPASTDADTIAHDDARSYCFNVNRPGSRREDGSFQLYYHHPARTQN